MLSNIVPVLHKSSRLAHTSLAMLALLIITSPAFAAGPQPQALPDGAASTLASTILGDVSIQNQPDATCPPDGQCFADVPPTNVFYAFINRIYQQDLVTGYPCGGFGEPCDPNSRPYYRPVNNVTRQQMAKFIDNARRLPGIHIETASELEPIYSSTTANGGDGLIGISDSGDGVQGINVSGGGFGIRGFSYVTSGVYGFSPTGYGVQGLSTSGYAVYASTTSSSSGTAVYGVSAAQNGYGVRGVNTNASGGSGVRGEASTGDGVYGRSTSGYGVHGTSTNSLAGLFEGNVQVTGNLSKGGGSFKIDHPLDPANQYLYHSFVESPDMMNVYNGNVTTDANGDATIELPNWFEALNRDFRYQLTPIGQFAQAMVSSEIKDNSFGIKTDKPNVKVSWQVTGIRQDPYANAHRIPVEEDKPADEQGKYLHPTEWGQPESMGVNYDELQQAKQITESKP